MDMTNQDYGKLVNQYSQSSPLGKNMVWAFLVGGAICTAGQGLSNLYQNWGSRYQSCLCYRQVL